MESRPSASLTPYNRSWCRPLVSLESMPLDIVYLITDYSAVRDVVALSSVSKTLRGLLSERSIWRKLYRRSPFLLPPGPYEWQSTSYLVNVLLRGENFHHVWPLLLIFPKVLLTQLRFGRDVLLSVLLSRWFVVAEGSTLVCYDSYHSNIFESAVKLHDAGVNRRIIRLFSVGRVQADGVFAIVVLLFKETFTIAKVLIEGERPSRLQAVFTSASFASDGWTDLVDVQLYHRLLVINVGECSSDWESSGRLVIMDIGTLHRYHLPPSIDDAVFDSMHATTFFFATSTHFIKVTESNRNLVVRSRMECYPLPSASHTSENDVLHCSHRCQVTRSIRMPECAVIHESPIDSETGRISFSLCGLDPARALSVVDACLEPDGSVSLMEFPLTLFSVKSFCIGMTQQHGYGVALSEHGQMLAFTLRYYEPGSVSFTYTFLDHNFLPLVELLCLDTFSGAAFFVHRSSDHTSVEIADFGSASNKQWMEGAVAKQRLYVGDGSYSHYNLHYRGGMSELYLYAGVSSVPTFSDM